MEKKVLKIKLIKAFDFIVSLYTALALAVIICLHAYVPFFPVLFLFDFSILIGYPLFLRFVLKKKWFECHMSKFLTLKYIIIPWAIMDTIVMLCYAQETLFIFKEYILNRNISEVNLIIKE